MQDLQKPNMWKRIAAALLDIILVFMIAVAIAYPLSLAFGYRDKSVELTEIRNDVQEKYGVDLSLNEEEMSALSPEIQDEYKKAVVEFNSNPRAAFLNAMVINLTLVLVSVGTLMSQIILEFIVPLLLKNGQTVGKKLFSIGVMSEDGVKISTFALFTRAVFGKYTIETMVPLYILMMLLVGAVDIVGIIIFVGLFIMQLAMVISTDTRSAIHDRMTRTVVIDFSSQKIFDTKEQLLAYKSERHAIAVEQAMNDY